MFEKIVKNSEFMSFTTSFEYIYNMNMHRCQWNFNKVHTAEVHLSHLHKSVKNIIEEEIEADTQTYHSGELYAI